MTFKQAVNNQITLLNQGKPLEAIDQFFSENIIMYDNDEVFAKGKAESRSKQELYINSAKAIMGNITDLVINKAQEVAIYRNKSKFIRADGKPMQIDGLCWQQWLGDQISVERYYSGEMMDEKIKEFYK